jgi:hypothetical protein
MRETLVMTYDRKLPTRLENLLVELRRVEKGAVAASLGREFHAYASGTGMVLLRPGPTEMSFTYGEIDELAHLALVDITDRRGNTRLFTLTDDSRSIADEHLW